MIKRTHHLSTIFYFLVNRFSFLQALTHANCLLCLDSCQLPDKICSACEKELPWITNHCVTCSLPFNTPTPITSSRNNRSPQIPATYAEPSSVTNSHKSINQICGQCLSRRPEFSQAVSAFQYHFPVSQMIQNGKYGNKRYWFNFLGDLLSEKLDRHYLNRSAPDIIIPVPIHKSRLKKRGFNQSLVIANRISKNTHLPVVAKVLLKHVETLPAAKMNKRNRENSIKNSLKVINHYMIKDKHIALVDDVMTTGSTANEASKILRLAGAKQVDVWCVARTPKEY